MTLFLSKGRQDGWPGLGTACACAVLWIGLTGCAQVRPQQPGLAAKPNMLFTDSRVFEYQNRLLRQVEPGSALTGGAQAAGASCCR
jgi:hypothetical protein